MNKLMMGLVVCCAYKAFGFDGETVVAIQTPFQPGARTARVLVPTHAALSRRVIYLLPVEAAGEHRFGDGMDEAEKFDLANKYGAAFVEPDFAQLPWYADNPANKDIQQESYLLKSVLPQVEAGLGWAEGTDRYLVGFSKSGWGALVLLIRHPDMFRGAAAWDAPLMKRHPDAYGMGDIIGSEENFRNYDFFRLISANPGALENHTVVLLGYQAFRADMQGAHDLLTRTGVVHVFEDGPDRPHNWTSGWVLEAVERVLSSRRTAR